MVDDTRAALTECEALLAMLEAQQWPEREIGPYRMRVGQLRDELTLLELMLGGWPSTHMTAMPSPPWQASDQTPSGKSPPPAKSAK